MTLENKQVLSDNSGPRSQPPSPPVRPPLKPAPLAWGLLAISVILFVLQTKLQQQIILPDGSPMLVPFGTLYGPAVRQGQWWRVFTYAFEHGGPIHILFNGMAIWNLGTALERIVGSWRFFLISVASTLGCATFGLFNNFDVPLLGASGMILGWAGALLPILKPEGRRQLSWMLIQVAAISLLPGVSFAGHLGGFLFGLPFGVALRFGPSRFNRAAPFLLFLSGVTTLVAVNPHRLGLGGP